MIYAKIRTPQSLEYAPKSATYNGTYYSEVPDEINLEQGYLPYQRTDAPEVTEPDKHAAFTYQAVNGTITEVWTIVDDSPETVCARLRQYLNETDKYWIQYSEGDKTAQEYEPYRVARQAARERIRELENDNG